MPTWTTPAAPSINQLIADGSGGSFDWPSQVTGNLSYLWTFKGVRAVSSGNQSLASSTITKVQLQTETFDAQGWFDNATNYRFLPTLAGIYRVTATATFDGVGTGGRCRLYVYKNGTQIAAPTVNMGSAVEMSVVLDDTVSLNGSTDYLELYASQDSGSSKNILTGAVFNAFLLGG
jgi:hypothetical protein